MKHLVFQAVWYQPNIKQLFGIVLLGVDVIALGWADGEWGWMTELCVLGVGLQFGLVDESLFDSVD